MELNAVEHNLLQKILDVPEKRHKQHRKYIMKYYQKQKVMDDGLSLGARVF
jgi:hypothetical protein